MNKTSKIFSFLVMAISVFGVVSCNNGLEEDEIIVKPAGEAKIIVGTISESTTWTADNQYLLSGFVYIASGVTLTIEPGTIIKGDKPTKGSLLILPGGKIMATGTIDKPIVFTSNQPVGQRVAGDWGGLVLLGKAPVNKPNAVVEGENKSVFGGTDAADNSGTLKYVRIEFAGIAFETDKEINGLTFAGVGSGTQIDYVQVSYSGDDSFEWFGGTVNAKHLIAYRGLDDDFDTDNGYSGRVQYGFILRDPQIADQAGDSNGFESDNDGSGSTATPQTSAKFANITVVMGDGKVNSKFASAMRLRRNTKVSAYNSVFTGGWLRSGLRVENDLTIGNFLKDSMQMQGVILALAYPDSLTKGMVEGIAKETFLSSNAKNLILTPTDLKLAAGFNSLTARPSILPQPGSLLLTSGTTLPTGFEPTTYVGAFSTIDWTATWANFDPQNTDYELKK